MTTYNPQIHHRRSIRLPNYDYSSVGYYFITICCAKFLPLFGQVQNEQMMLNAYGQIAYEQWLATAQIRPNVCLHEFVIMPNHMHAIIQITEQRPSTIMHQHGTSQTVGAIVRGYKTAVSARVKQSLGHTVWHRNYYEHIIRDDHAYHRISEYIINNPKNWEQDKFYTVSPII